MKYICIIVLCIGVFGYGYLRGYCIGYDDASEAHTKLYNKIIEIYKRNYEDIKIEMEKQKLYVESIKEPRK